IFDGAGNPRPNFHPRPYPRLTAGLPIHFEFRNGDATKGGRALVFTWDNRPELGETEIALPAASSDPARGSTSHRRTLSCTTTPRDDPSSALPPARGRSLFTCTSECGSDGASPFRKEQTLTHFPVSPATSPTPRLH